MATKGHWRKLPPTSKGEGINGEVTYGKTWVDPYSTTTSAPISEPKKESRSQKDLRLWKVWKEDPTKENLGELMESLQGIINSSANNYRSVAVPPSAMRGKAQLLAVKAIRTYDPSKGTTLVTHTVWYLKKLQAFAGKHQNLGRIPEHRLYKIKSFKLAKSSLVEALGVPPDAQTLADELGWSLKEVTRMEKELSQRDLIASKSIVPDTLPEWVVEEGEVRELMRYIYYELSPEERSVFEYSTGTHGKPQMTPGEIAKELKISNAKVSRIKKKINDKIIKHGGM